MAYCLGGLSLVLWYAIGYRYFLLQSSLLSKTPKKLLSAREFESEDLLSLCLKKIKKVFTQNLKDQDLALETERTKFVLKLSQHRQTIRSIVMVAPLLGLLGTVIGMIETFDSLQDSALFSQSGGIAGGISQALITTQLGLVVAIPGLLIGRKLDRKQEQLQAFVDQYIGLSKLEQERL